MQNVTINHVENFHYSGTVNPKPPKGNSFLNKFFKHWVTFVTITGVSVTYACEKNPVVFEKIIHYLHNKLDDLFNAIDHSPKPLTPDIKKTTKIIKKNKSKVLNPINAANSDSTNDVEGLNSVAIDSTEKAITPPATEEKEKIECYSEQEN